MKIAFLCIFLTACSTPTRQEQPPIVGQPFTFPKEKTVNIEGFVKHPGAYRWYTGMTLGDLLTKAGGPTEFAGRVCFKRGSVQSIFCLPKPSDKLWNRAVEEGETVKVLHKEMLEYDLH